MPEFSSHPPGTPCWVDLMSPDVDASKEFYTSVFGWDARDEHDDEGNRVYVTFSLDGKSVAGLPGVGRMATAHDPSGGNFNILQPAT